MRKYLGQPIWKTVGFYTPKSLRKKGNVIKTINLSFQQKSLRILDFVIKMEDLWNTEIIWIQNEKAKIGSHVRNRISKICDHFNSTDIENKCLQAPELRGGNLSNLASTRTFSCLNQSNLFLFSRCFFFCFNLINFNSFA